MKLVIGNKNYSSWSMRAWLVAKLSGLDFTEVMMDLSDASVKEKILELSGAARVPIMVIDEVMIWDSLSISEYCAERIPVIWPLHDMTRARARSVVAEIHSSFMALRTEMPMNIRASDRKVGLSAEALEDLRRVNHILTTAKDIYQSTFLFGDKPSIVDCFVAPIISRLTTYRISYADHITFTDEALAYMETIKNWPLYLEWVAAARQETSVLRGFERGQRANDI